MHKRIVWLFVVMSLLLAALLPCCALAAADEVSLVLERVSPDTMPTAGNVTVTFTVKLALNASDPMEDVTILKGGTELAKLGSSVKPGYSPTYTVSVPLTAAEIGSPVTLTVSWTQAGESFSKNLPAFTVKQAEAVTSVVFTRSADPTSVKSGEEVTLKYRTVNTGNVPMTGLSIKDGVLGEVGTRDTLSGGDTWEVSIKKKVTENFTSKPVLSFTAAGAAKTETCDDLAISLASAKLTAKLKASASRVKPGEQVTLTCEVKNNGSLDFQSLKFKDEALGQDFTGPRLQVGTSTPFTKTVTVNEETSYTFTITAVDENGKTHTFKSNTVTVGLLTPEATPTPMPEDTIGFTVSVDNSRMNSEKKADLTFEVVNRSTDTFTDVEIRDDRYDLIAQADSLPSGNHTMTAEVSMGQEREFTFYLTFKDPNGDLMEYVSDPIWVRYPQAAVTQAPAATPAPTAELQATIAPMPTQNSADKPMDLRHIGLVVGFVVLGILVLAAIVALIILVPRIVENIRVMQDHRERLERDATRSRSTAKRRRK